ncbi:MAG: Nif3-like dinuclear metal center hexameric protein [Thermoguttaceae bacterium]
MTTFPLSLREIVKWLDCQYAPKMAEEWDNVGLLLGNTDKNVERMMTCLTITPAVCDEAVSKKVDVIVSHHPFPFRPMKKMTTETVSGTLLLRLLENRIAVYSPHTAHDSAPNGVNEQLAAILQLENIEPLNENGSGRLGTCPTQSVSTSALLSATDSLAKNQTLQSSRTLIDIVSIISNQFGPCQYIGNETKVIRRIAIGCGAADDFISISAAKNADLLLLGESRFHACLEADALGIALILMGHYASERFAMETMAKLLQQQFPSVDCFASCLEHDPIKWFHSPYSFS